MQNMHSISGNNTAVVGSRRKGGEENYLSRKTCFMHEKQRVCEGKRGLIQSPRP